MKPRDRQRITDTNVDLHSTFSSMCESCFCTSDLSWDTAKLLGMRLTALIERTLNRTNFILLYCIVLYCMVWYGMVWYGMVWYGMVWYSMVWYGMVSYRMVSYGILLYYSIIIIIILLWF